MSINKQVSLFTSRAASVVATISMVVMPFAGVVFTPAAASALVSQTTVILTSGSSWTVPADWSSSSTIQVIGGGGGGGGAGSSIFSNGGAGGGGGAFAKISNLSLVVGHSVTYQIGSGGSGNTGSGDGTDGGDTFFNRTSGNDTACNNGNMSVCAKGGHAGNGNGGSGGSGGSASHSVGSVTNSGGTGASGGSNGGGGAGAAGPNGAGVGGSGTTGGNGDASHGGAGGVTPNNGANGTEFDSTHGSGGGGAGGSGSNDNGGNGGTYGAGGGGGDTSGGNGGAGKQGLIVIAYTPADITAPTLAQVTPVTTPTNDNTPSYTFSSTEAGTITYTSDCSSATTAAVAGNNTVTFNTLVDGTHSNCKIKVTDAAGNVSSLLTVSSFTVDTTPPDTSITSGPTGTVSANSAAFTFTSTESPSTFQCSIDGGSYSTCTSGSTSYNGLSDGSHTFTVRATDAVGNTDPTPASRTWTVDATGPTIAITSPTEAQVTTTSGTITYTVGDSVSVVCTLDGSPVACTTGGSYGFTLADGPHTFTVKGTDAVGNIGNTASVNWTVFTLPAITFPLTVTVTGTGSGSVTSSPAGISCGVPLVDCSENYGLNTVVTLTATPAPILASFTGWSGDCSGTGPCVVTMAGAKNVTANFTSSFNICDFIPFPGCGNPIPTTHTLTVNTTGGGTVTVPTGISCGTHCTSYTDGMTVVLTANPDVASTLGAWGGDCTGTVGLVCTLTMSSDKSVSASFTVTPTTGTIEITKYACPAETAIARSSNGVGGTVPNGCTLESGATFGYVHGDQTDAGGPYPELAGPFTEAGTTNGSGVLSIADLPSSGRYLVVETDGSGHQLTYGDSDVLGLFCTGDGDTSDNNDNQELTFVPTGGTVKCVAYNKVAAPSCNANASQTIVSNTDTQQNGHNSFPVDPIHERWTASIPDATWIWGENPIADAVNQTSETFTKTFTIIGTPTGATLDIAADNSYSVSVNDHDVCADASELNYQSTGQDICTVPAGDLISGTNTITLTVTNFAQDGGTMATNPAGLLYKLVVTNNECLPVELVLGCMDRDANNFDPEATQNYGCTYTPEGPTTGTLIIVKKTHGGDGTFEFNIGEDATTSVTTSDGQGISQSIALNPGTYNLTEVPQTDWDFTSSYCSYSGDTEGTNIANGEQVTITSGDTVTCWFNNNKHIALNGYKFSDENNNNSWDGVFPDTQGNEDGLQDWTINAVPTDSQGAPEDGSRAIMTTTTDEAGHYSFSFSTDDQGWWVISEVPQTNWTQTFPYFWSGEGDAAQKVTRNSYLVHITVGDDAGFDTSDQVGIPSSHNDESGHFFDFGNHFTAPSTPTTPTCSSTQHLVDNECVDNGGGGNGPIVGSIPSGQVLGASIGPSGEVLGASTSTCSDMLLKDYMRRGKNNDPEQVKILQQFLNDEMHSNLPLSGFFGKATEEAVKAFQKKYGADILDPWKITDPTGFVYKTTLRKINQLHCDALNIPMPDLTPWTDTQ